MSGYLGSWKVDDLLTFPANTHRFDTGAGTDADSPATYRIYEDETGTPILTGTMALLDSANTAGFYSEQITLSAANGFEKGKCYTIYITATVNSVVATTSKTFQIEAEVDANIVSDKAGYSLSGTQTFNVTGNITGNLSGSVGSVTGSVGSVTSGVTVTTNNDKAGYALSAAGIQAVWDALTSALTTVGSIGKLLVDNINAAIGSRASQATADAIEADTQDIQSKVGTPSNLGSGATVAANLVDIEGQTDDIGLAGAGLTNVPWNSAWDTEVESEVTDALNSYDPPTRAELTSDTNSVLSAISAVSGFIDTEITTITNRIGAFTGTGVNTILGFFQALMRKDVTTPSDVGGTYDDAADSLEAIRDRGDAAWLTATGFSTLTQADVRTAVGLGSANLDTQLGAIDSVADKLDTTLEVDGPVYRFTTNALEQAPAGGGGGGTGLINFVYGGEWVLNQQNRIDFYLQSSAGAAVAGLGSGYTLTLAKNGAAFAASAGTKAEIGNGWYTYLATAGEADTIGTIAAKAVGAGAVEQNLEYVVKQRTAGAIAFTYTLTSTATGLPIEGAIVWTTTDLAGTNTIWSGVTDAFGVARDSASGLPYLDPGTYYFFRQHGQFAFTNPDVEVVS